MKLKNKLIPLVAIVGTASLVAPLVTLSSCSKQSMTEYDFVAKEYEYDGGIADDLKPTTTTATKMFYDAAKDSNLFEKEIVAKEWLSYLSEEASLAYNIRSGNFSEDSDILEHKVQISKPVIGTTTVYFPGEDSITYPTVSFKIVTKYKDHIEIEHSGRQSAITQYQENVWETTREYANIPFLAYSEAGYLGDEWNIGFREMLTRGQDFIFKYMIDTFAINISANIQTTSWTSEAEGSKITRTSTINHTIDNYNKLLQLKSYDLSSPKTAMVSGWNTLSDSEILDAIYFDFTSNYLSVNSHANEITSSGMAYLDVDLDDVTEERPESFTVKIKGFKYNGTWDGIEKTLKLDSAYYGSFCGSNVLNLDDDTFAILKKYQLVVAKDAPITKETVGDYDQISITATISATGVAAADRLSTELLGNLLESNGFKFKFPRVLTVADQDGKNAFDMYTNVTSLGAYPATVITCPTINHWFDYNAGYSNLALNIYCNTMDDIEDIELEEINGLSFAVGESTVEFNTYTNDEWGNYGFTSYLSSEGSLAESATYTCPAGSYIQFILTYSDGFQELVKIPLDGIQFTTGTK